MSDEKPKWPWVIPIEEIIDHVEDYLHTDPDRSAILHLDEDGRLVLTMKYN